MYTEAEVDAYILKASRLRITSRGYKAIKILLEQGNILYWVLGNDDTLDLCKIFIFLNFSYQHVSGGVQLREDSKSNFYHTVMYPKKTQTFYNDYRSKTLSVGKEEREEKKIGWNERRFSDQV
jgi:hypothetical protein